jgi:hypothetical protein
MSQFHNGIKATPNKQSTYNFGLLTAPLKDSEDRNGSSTNRVKRSGAVSFTNKNLRLRSETKLNAKLRTLGK